MNAAHVSLLTRTEIRHRYRAVRANDRKFGVYLLLGVFFLLPLAAILTGLYAFGGSVAGGSLPEFVSMDIVRGGAGAIILMIAALNTIRTIQTGATPSNADGVLIMADHSEVVASTLVVETLVGAWIILIPGTLGAVAFGIGAGSVLAGAAFLAAILCTAALGSALGIALGFVVKNALARSETLSRYRTPAGVVLFLLYMYVIVANEFESAFDPIINVLGQTPLGWFGDLALVTADVGSSPSLAGGSLLVTVAGITILSVAVDRLAGLLWYVESVEASTGETDSSGIGGIAGLPRPVARIVRRSWLRAYRSPLRLFFVVYPLFFIIAPISDAIQTGVVPGYLPATIALYGAWATGSAFTLNPLGEEGDVLPVTLTSPVSGRSFIAGCCLAGVLIGLPVSVLAVLVAAVIAGNSIPLLAGSVALALVLPVVAVGMAAGVGVTFPRFEEVNVTRSREAVVPSLIGFAVYSIALTIAASPGLAVQFEPVREGLADATGITPAGAIGIAIGVTVVLGGAFAVLGFMHAARTFDSHRLE
jgi:hypothetical protein